MKRAVVFLFALAICACAPALAAADAPSVQYQSTIVHNHEATLRFTIDTGGLPTEFNFEWGPTTAYGEPAETYNDGPIPAAGEPVQIEFVVSPPYLAPLKAGTEYHYRVSVENEDGEEVGADQAFTTTDGLPPIVADETASDEMESSAVLHGTVNPEGSTLTACRFRVVDDVTWRNKGFVAGDMTPPLPLGTTVPCAESLGEIGSGSEPVPVHAEATGLDPGRYYFRLEAENQYEEAAADYSGVAFDTFPGAPLIEYGAADPIRNTEATLHFSIDPRGLETEYELEWQRAGYEFEDSHMAQVIPAGEEPVDREVTIPRYWEGGIYPGLEYHWRVRAWNAAGETIGPEQHFTATDVPAPVFTNLTATQTGPETVVFTGTVDPEGVPLTGCRFRWVTPSTFKYAGFEKYAAVELVRFGETVPCKESLAEIGSGTEPVTVHGEATIEGLDWYFRLEGENAYEDATAPGGVYFNVDQDFGSGDPPTESPGGSHEGGPPFQPPGPPAEVPPVQNKPCPQLLRGKGHKAKAHGKKHKRGKRRAAKHTRGKACGRR
jgi:hypothetical protein